MKKLHLLCWAACVSGLAQTYYLPQLPRLSSVSSGDLVPVWSGTNLYSATASGAGIGSGKLDTTNGTAVNLTVNGTFDTSGGTSPLSVDTANYRVQFRGGGGGSPFNVRANNVRFGADDGATTLSSITPSFGKDISFYSYDYNLNDWGLIRGIAASGGNTLQLGFGSSGSRGATTLSVKLGSSTSDTTGTSAAVWTLNKLTVQTPLTVAGANDTLIVDTSNNRVAVRGDGGSSPFNVRANNIRLGADDGAASLSTITSAANKDISIYSYDYNLNDWGFIRGSASSSANTLQLGFGSSGSRGATAIAFRTASSTSDTTGTQVGAWNTSGLTVQVPLTVQGTGTPLYADTANTRVHINGLGGSMPFNVIGNVVRMGADDGAISNRTVTSGTDKDFNLAVYTRDNNEFVVMRAIGGSANNALYLGGGQGGYRQSTQIYFMGSGSVSATSATAYGRLDGVNGEWGIGSSSTTSGSVLTVNSTTKAAIPFPRQSTVQWTAYTPPQGSQVYDTTLNKIGVYDGTTRRYVVESLIGSVTWDIPNITAGTEQTTTLTVTGAAVGDQVVVDGTRPAANVMVVGMVTATDTVTLYAMNTGAAIDPISRIYRVNVIRQ